VAKKGLRITSGVIWRTDAVPEALPAFRSVCMDTIRRETNQLVAAPLVQPERYLAG
jgi:hypothetical protein